ncbi:MAG: bifunctional 23S rRNA (guanine(2069)-N(7))-methyltransferase RlmK/23S rRNA (guanine(2445)-N(2))-methyltransferase RlmL [Chromatiales bacterium]
MSSLRFFATAPKGTTALLMQELREFGAEELREVAAGVVFAGTLETGYRACLWSRTASRVLLSIAQFKAPDPEALYSGVQTVRWDEQLRPSGTLAVDCNTRQSPIRHSRFAAQKVKDAIVDQLRQRHRARPSVALERPDIRVNVFLHRDEASVAIDLSGDSLHRRGYRERAVEAPLKENLAAAILLRAGWPAIAHDGDAFVDLMCGSGTLPIEAALMAGDIAPAINRQYFGFLSWQGHVPTLWRRLLEEARERTQAGRARVPSIFGCDSDENAVRAARANVARAGLQGVVQIERGDLSVAPEPRAPRGLVAANPPYGERLGEIESLRTLYAELGTCLRERYTGWEAAVFTGNPALGRHLGLKARRTHVLYNGSIECRLLRFGLDEQSLEKSTEERRRAAAARPPSVGAQMFANRLHKNLRNVARWAVRQQISCYRLYDADMPEYAVAIDLYHSGERRFVLVQEYAAPKNIDADKAKRRLREILNLLPAALEVERERIILKRRERQSDRSQYEKLAATGEFHEVREGPCRLLVNFTDYLDTGLFLDHRITRSRLSEWAQGRDFLNLFCYTAAATVHAAMGGAASSLSVDMSATYLGWARRNFALNGLDTARHRLMQADCLTWLEQRARDSEARSYGLIFLDPPTFSTSKRMRTTLDIQRDHVQLIRLATSLLTADGTLVFSTNRQRFRLDVEGLSDLKIVDITVRTIPRDFARNPRVHRCWRMTR